MVKIIFTRRFTTLIRPVINYFNTCGIKPCTGIKGNDWPNEGSASLGENQFNQGEKPMSVVDFLLHHKQLNDMVEIV